MSSFPIPDELQQSIDDIEKSSEFINLKDLIQDIESQKRNEKGIAPTKFSKLQILREKVEEKLPSNDVISTLFKANQITGNAEQQENISKLSLENEQLKGEIDDLKAENSQLSEIFSKNSRENEEKENIRQQTKQMEQKYIRMIEELKRKLSEQENIINDKESEIENLNDSNKSLVTANSELEKEVSKRDKKIQKLEDIAYDVDEEKRKLEAQIEDLKLQIELKQVPGADDDNKESLMIENEQLKQQNSDLLALIDSQTQQYESQFQEILSLTTQKNKLATMVYNLLRECELYDAMKEGREEELIKEREITPEVEEHANFDKLISQIKLLAESDKEITEIINNEEMEGSEKVINIIEGLIKEKMKVRSQESLVSMNKRLTDAVFSQLKFISELSNSKELQKLMIEAPQNEFLRRQLINAVQTTNEFLVANNITLHEEQSLFDFLLPRTIADQMKSQEKLIENLSNYLDEHEDAAESELFLIVVQCLTCNTVLMKYSTEVKNIAQKHTFENRTLKQQLNSRSVIEPEYSAASTRDAKTMPESEKETIQRLAIKCREMLAEQYEDADLRPLDELIDSIGGDELKENQQYVMKLEKKVLSQKAKLTETTEKYNAMINELNEELLKLQEEFKEVSEQKSGKVEEYVQQIEELKGTVQDTEKENEELRQELEQTKEEINKITEEKDQEIDEIKKQCKEVGDIFDHILVELHTKNQELTEGSTIIARGVEHLRKKFVHMMRTSNQTIKKKVMQVLAENDKTIKKMEKELKQTKTALDQTKEERDKLKENLTEEKKNALALSVKVRTLELKAKSSDEAAKREINLKQKQLEFQARAREAEANQKAEHAKLEASRQTHEVYTKICRTFKEFVDITQPISAETVDTVIKRASERIKAAKQAAIVKEELLEEQDILRRILNVKPGTNVRLSSALSDFVHKANLQGNKIEVLENENKRMKKEITDARSTNVMASTVKEWEAWCAKISDLLFGHSATPEETKKAIENVVLSSTDKSATTRKIELLRNEKKIVMLGLDQRVRKQLRPSLIGPILAFTALLHIQKLSGHVHTDMGIGIDANDDEDNDEIIDFDTNSRSSSQRAPLFQKFVIP